MQANNFEYFFMNTGKKANICPPDVFIIVYSHLKSIPMKSIPCIKDEFYKRLTKTTG